MHEPSTIFSQQELDNIRKMAVQMGADFCEFDVLRDNGSGRIYVIDVNKTPYGPPAGLSANESKHAVMLLTQAFRQAFEN
jgi:glutathione synthase/RimK-type ligase-like ATP-grasp enzyme